MFQISHWRICTYVHRYIAAYYVNSVIAIQSFEDTITQYYQLIVYYCVGVVVAMESTNGLHDKTAKEQRDPLKDVQMKELSFVDPKVDTQEKFNDFNKFVHHSTSNGNTLTQLNRMLGMQQKENKLNAIASRSVIASVILLVVGMFSVPIILYYTLKTDPPPALNSELGDVNISMASYIIVECIYYIS